jgi:hypothetical protein
VHALAATDRTLLPFYIDSRDPPSLKYIEILESGGEGKVSVGLSTSEHKRDYCFDTI